MSDVREICAMTELTSAITPNAEMVGLMNVRGDVIPILDLRLRYGMPLDAPSEERRVVVVNVDGGLYGLLVDSLDSILSRENSRSHGAPPASMLVGRAALARAMSDVAELLQVPSESSQQLLLVLDARALLTTVGADTVEAA